MKDLTEKQKSMLDFIEDFQTRQGMSPTVYEIASNFGVKTSTVFAHLRALQRKNQLSRSSKARSIALARRPAVSCGTKGGFCIPLLGRVSAGLPAESIAYKEGEVIISEAQAGNIPQERLFALRVQGESMREIGIYEGDTLIVAQGETIRPGDIVVALVGGDVTVKSYFRMPNGTIELRPANQEYRVQVYRPEEVQIQGKVLGLQRSY